MGNQNAADIPIGELIETQERWEHGLLHEP
jgi:hypothetical protein